MLYNYKIITMTTIFLSQRGADKLRDQTEEVDALKGYSKHEISELKEQMHKSYEEQLKRITEMVVLVLIFFLQSNSALHFSLKFFSQNRLFSCSLPM